MKRRRSILIVVLVALGVSFLAGRIGAGQSVNVSIGVSLVGPDGRAVPPGRYLLRIHRVGSRRLILDVPMTVDARGCAQPVVPLPVDDPLQERVLRATLP